MPDTWPVGNGEMAGRLRALRDGDTPLGPPARWSMALRATIDVMLASQAQMVLFWGNDFVAFYNDRYAATVAHQHPAGLGQPAARHWADVWDEMHPQLLLARRGETVSRQDRPCHTERNGRREEVFLDLSYSPVHDVDGSVGGVLCIVSESTARVQTARALALSESLLRETADQWRLAQAAGGVGVFLLDVTADTLRVSPGFCRVYGLPEEQAVLASAQLEALKVDPLGSMSSRRSRSDGTAVLDTEYQIRRANDGELRWVARRAEFVRDAAGRPLQMRGVVQDVTARRVAEDTLRESEARFRALAQSIPNHVWTAGPDGRLDWVNQHAVDYTGLAPNALHADGWASAVHPQDIERVDQTWQHAVATGTAYETEFRLRRHDGAYRWHLARAQPVTTAEEPRARWVGANTDIHDQKDAQVQLAELNATLEQRVQERTRDRDRLWQLSTDVMMTASLDGDVLAVNPAWKHLLGWSETAMVGQSMFAIVHPDDLAATRAEADRLARGQVSLRHENRLRHRDGSYRTVSWTGVSDGRLIHAVGRDVTALRESEARLRQSQKMEAIGQLTGGIAHDFNNMLQGITGSIEVMRRRVALGRTDDLERFMNAASQSAMRAASLVQRLLAFSRRQSLDSKPLDLNALIASMEDLLHRTLGEQVRLRVQLDPQARIAQGDESQLESAILNLAINARDAMPHGGELGIATGCAVLGDAEAQYAGIAPGPYLTIAVADTGTGMPPDVLAKAFDPFFTTKPIGQGTGLGLSMVYGFAQQSGGQVRIDSAPGRGTTVTLYLPQAVEPDLLLAGARAAEEPLQQGHGEVVLVVEDDPGVRLLVLDLLAELGYQALEAADGAAALPILASSQRIDLLVSDVGLPGLNGRQVAEIGRQYRPGLQVLFMTGYAEHATNLSEFLEPGMQLIAKPFQIDALAQAVRKILGDGR